VTVSPTISEGEGEATAAAESVGAEAGPAAVAQPDAARATAASVMKTKIRRGFVWRDVTSDVYRPLVVDNT